MVELQRGSTRSHSGELALNEAMERSQGTLREELHCELLAVPLNTHTRSRSLHQKIKFRLKKIRFKL